MTETPVPLIDSDFDLDSMLDTPWVVIVWNDPVNLMSYVVHVLQKLFVYTKEQSRLHGHGLWATMQKDE